MLTLTLKEFEDLNIFSHKNMEEIARSLVNKSSNASFVSMYDDSVILFDHEEGQFYASDYKFDDKKLIFEFINFESVELVKETGEFREKLYEFFDDENGSAVDLSESYKNDVVSQERYINELIKDSLAAKDFTETIDYSELEGINESVSISNEPFFKSYKERLKTHPLNEIKFFNWKDDVYVSLVETEQKKLLKGNAAEKAKELWKRDSFKESFVEAANIFTENVEEGAEKLKELLEEYPQIFFLDAADRKTMFGKAIMSSVELIENMDDLLEGLSLMFEKFDLSEMRQEYLQDINEQDDDEEEVEEPESKEEKEEKEEPVELSPEDLKKIADQLKSIAEKIEDEPLKKKLDGIISKLEKGKEEGTKPEEVKEAVALLSM